MSQSPAKFQDFDYQSTYTDAAAQLNKLVRSGKSYSGHERNRVFLNVDGQRFANASMISGFDFPEDGRSIALCDWDGDGDQDFWVANRTAPQIRFMENQIGDRNQAVRYRLLGTKSNRDAIGARVSIQILPSAAEHTNSEHAADGTSELPTQLQRTLRAGEGFLACHSKEISFGVGNGNQINSVSVRWPSGETEVFQNGELAGRTYVLEEGTGVARLYRTHTRSTPAAESVMSPATTPAIPQQSMATQNVLLQPAPMPPLMYESEAGSLVDASVGSDKPTLLTLWATWCMPCLEEIRGWSQDSAELKQHVNLLPLSVDKLSTGASPEVAATEGQPTALAIKDVLMQIGHRGQYGWASPEMLDVLQQVHNVIYDHHRQLPLPCSFLLDRKGNLRAVYKGPVSSRRILQDTAALTVTSDQESLPFKGRWMGPLGSHNLQLLVEELYREGYETEALAYVERLSNETFRARQIGSRLFLAQQLSTSDPAAATRQTKAVLKAAPNEPRAHERLALLYARSQNTSQAKHHFGQAIQHQSEPDPRTHYNFGKLLRGQGEIPEAWEQFKLALQSDPEFDQAYEQLGLIRASQRQFKDAAQLFGSAVALQPRKASYRVNLAMALVTSKRDADAWSALKPIITDRDVPSMALLLAARSLGNLKRNSEAIPLLERFLQREPDAADVRKQLDYMRRQASMTDAQSAN